MVNTESTSVESLKNLRTGATSKFVEGNGDKGTANFEKIETGTNILSNDTFSNWKDSLFMSKSVVNTESTSVESVKNGPTEAIGNSE